MTVKTFIPEGMEDDASRLEAILSKRLAEMLAARERGEVLPSQPAEPDSDPVFDALVKVAELTYYEETTFTHVAKEGKGDDGL